ncbi:MAG: hypothetical protein PHV55_07000 [Candidatus Omnitrophica bacterium]|nr:hypothetical protein [Candidatus Omnitrophota bacterium]
MLFLRDTLKPLRGDPLLHIQPVSTTPLSFCFSTYGAISIFLEIRE